MLTKVLGWAASIPLILSWIPACNALAKIEQREPAQLACAACVEQTCAPAVSACRNEAVCSTRFDCDSACNLNDETCLSECDNPLTVGAPELPAAVTACASASCAGPCNTQCGGITTPTPEASATACAQCAATNCCIQEQACANNVDCVRIRECLRDHASSDATSNCTDVRYPAGSDAYHAYDACLMSACKTDCAFGALWTCVGRVQTPVAAKPQVTVSYIFADAQAQSHGVPGLMIRGCRTNDVTCVTPLTATATTDATGTGTLVLPTTGADGQTLSGFDGYIEIVDPTQKYVTALLFSGVPIVEDVSTRRVVLVAAADLAALTKFAGITPDPQHGYVATAITDCAGRLAPRMTVATDTLDSLTKGFYTRTGIFNPGATDTDENGVIAYVNMPAGLLTMKATSEDLNRVVSVVSASVRPSAVSLVQLPPTARQQ